MTEEIKEILDKLNNKAEHYILYNYEVKLLLDYITNLQEEYEKEHYLVDKLTRQLTDEYKNTEYQCKQKEVYKSRNEKAIELLKHDMENFDLEDGYSTCEKALIILQGEDKDVKD